MHTLVIDAGNSQTAIGLFVDDTLVQQWRLSTHRHYTADELAWQMHGIFVRAKRVPEDIDYIMIASVVPWLDKPLSEACIQIFSSQAQFVGKDCRPINMPINYQPISDVGADRLVNAAAAKDEFGAPVIVVDCGTATTFDLVDASGAYSGGLIIPGAETALEALCQRAARLPEVSFTRCTKLLAQDTVHSLQAGSYWAVIDSISGIVRRLQTQTDFTHAPIVLTGGIGDCIYQDLNFCVAYRPHLTLRGLYMLNMSTIKTEK
ncbi:MAG: type III pantothenate kinase [Mariprofundales bacterium]